MTTDERIRAAWLGYGEKRDLPSRFWEPEPDEEDLERMAKENKELWMDDEPLPFE